MRLGVVPFVSRCEALSADRVSVLDCAARGLRAGRQRSYLVDPASSHMLVSKIKPCMSKYKRLYTVKLRTAH